MKQMFDDLSARVCKMTTKAYSTSFSLGIYFIDSRLRDAIYSIYGFVRLADEIVDSFEGYDKKALLQKFTAETHQAIAIGISCNPIINAFQRTVKKYSIRQHLIDDFLKSMEMDLQKIEYDRTNFDIYILGSAEVVGLMCLCVFTNGDADQYEELRPFAMKLGAAFQKVNFLRDMKYDYQVLGRIYFPGIDISGFSADAKKQIEREIDDDFRIALEGIRKLPASSKGGVYLAYVYYKSLFNKIRKLPAARLLSGRVRINNSKKFRLMINSLVEYKMNLI